MKLPKAIIIDGKECLDILCCKILIWEANSDVIEINDPDENKCLVIRECESIENLLIQLPSDSQEEP